MAVPAEEIPEPCVVTGFAFHRVPSGSAGATLNGVTVHMGTTGGDELGPEFSGNRLTSTAVIRRDRMTVNADDDQMVVFMFDTPWEYTGGNILLEMRFEAVAGYLYVFGWTAPGMRYLSSRTLDSARGAVSGNLPVITLITE